MQQHPYSGIRLCCFFCPSLPFFQRSESIKEWHFLSNTSTVTTVSLLFSVALKFWNSLSRTLAIIKWRNLWRKSPFKSKAVLQCLASVCSSEYLVTTRIISCTVFWILCFLRHRLCLWSDLNFPWQLWKCKEDEVLWNVNIPLDTHCFWWMHDSLLAEKTLIE